MTISSASVIFFSSLLSIPVTFLCNFYRDHLSQLMVLGIGTAVCSCMLIFVYIFRKKDRPVDFLYYVFALCCMSSVVDLLIAFENQEIIRGFVRFYLEQGEPYLKTAYGTLICLWDGTAHYALYLHMLAAMSWSQSCREVGLFWCGSIINSLIVFLPGNFIGQHTVKASVMLNVPFVLVPIYALWRFLNEKDNDNEPTAVTEKPSQSIFYRPKDLFLFLWTFICIGITCFRGCTALTKEPGWMSNYTETVEPLLADPSSYARLQVIAYFYLMNVFYLHCCYALLTPGRKWFSDTVYLAFGAICQGQFSYIGAAFHARTPYVYRLPFTPINWPFWIVNVNFIVHLFCLWLRTESRHCDIKPFQRTKKKHT